MSKNPVRVCMIGITKHGVKQITDLAAALPECDIIVSEKFADSVSSLDNNCIVYQGALSANIAQLFGNYDQIIFFVSLGAVVRLIAPHLKSKDEDPGVLVVDDAAQFVIPVLSGHVGGANAYAEKLAGIIGATPVVTTASDVGKTIPVDILGRELGWTLIAPKINVTRVSAHVVNEEPVAFIQENGSKNWWTRPTPLPANIRLFERFEDVPVDEFKALLWVTNRQIEDQTWEDYEEKLVVYRVPELESGAETKTTAGTEHA